MCAKSKSGKLKSHRHDCKLVEIVREARDFFVFVFVCFVLFLFFWLFGDPKLYKLKRGGEGHSQLHAQKGWTGHQIKRNYYGSTKIDKFEKQDKKKDLCLRVGAPRPGARRFAHPKPNRVTPLVIRNQECQRGLFRRWFDVEKRLKIVVESTLKNRLCPMWCFHVERPFKQPNEQTNKNTTLTNKHP